MLSRLPYNKVLADEKIMLARYGKPANCSGCQLETRGTGYVPADGPERAKILFIGESAGYNDAVEGRPFIGATGSMLHRIFQRAQVNRETVRIDNVCRCRPPEDWLDGAPWQHSALTHCAPYLQSSLDSPSLQVVVTLGSIPMKQILGLWDMPGVRVQDFHGTVHRDPSDRFWVVPTYHPSFLQRGAMNLLDVTRFDVAVAQRIINEGRPQSRPFTLYQDPAFSWFRAWADCFLQRLRQEGFAWLAADIETPDKSGGRDENELTSEDTSTEILRINFSSRGEEGITVPWVEPYIGVCLELLNSGAWLALWNKKYDESRLRFRGVTFKDPHGADCTLIDGMWAAHHLQSDLPLGLGFWGPFYSPYGAWKHLGKIRGREAEYAAIDGLQTYRIVPEGIVPQLEKEGLWDAFWRHTHQREQYVLRPAWENGIPVSEERLDAFHEKLQVVAAERLAAINENGLAGNFSPKAGYAKEPKGKAGQPPQPPVGISGFKHREKGDHAKADYIDQGITLVQREVAVPYTYCSGCAERIRASHTDCTTVTGEHPPLVSQSIPEVRWFWQLPFNPDANAQLLRFIRDSGEAPGKAKKTKKDTANKETLRKLWKKTGNPIYKHILDYKAIKKVDSTYALGLKKRIWKADGRIHPEITFRPSMFRDSSINPNIQNVIADKDAKPGSSGSLAAGLRACIVADPGWRLIEVDYSGTEAVDTGWYIGDPKAIRLATLGVHAYLCSHILYERKQLSAPADLAWSDQDLAKFFSEIKKKFPDAYDKAKRCVHGNNYGLTPYGMAENFPDVYTTVKEAQHTQDLYYGLIPGLPVFHQKLRDVAYETEQIGGSYVDDYYSLTSGKHHPFGYRHKFYGVQTYKPLSETEYRRLQWIAEKKLKVARHPRVRMINKRPFEVVLGEDSKRVIAMYPQSNSSGKLKEAELTLFHPESPNYIGEAAEGRTPLCSPIHDSLLLHVPDRGHEMILSIVVEVMRRPLLQMPCPAEWGIGSHIRTNVAVKVSPVGGSWEDVETIEIPDMAPATASETLYLPVEESEWEDMAELETKVEMEKRRIA